MNEENNELVKFRLNNAAIGAVIKEQSDEAATFLVSVFDTGQDLEAHFITNGDIRALINAMTNAAEHKELILTAALNILVKNPKEAKLFNANLGLAGIDNFMENMKAKNGGVDVHDCENCPALKDCPLPEAAEYLSKNADPIEKLAINHKAKDIN